jgi:predicted glycosyltransferase
MKLLFYLGHPAHFHLFKNTIKHFKDNGTEVQILIKKKDVLENLLDEAGLEYINIFPKTRGTSKTQIIKTLLKREGKLFQHCVKNKPDLLIGTSVENSHIGKLLGIPSINVNEDDHDVVPLYSKFSYPLANCIVCPTSCSTGKWQYKAVNYYGYHELAYLHPNHFTPHLEIASKYVDVSKPYFLIRFAKLTAHHDNGIRGFTDDFAEVIVNKLRKYGNVYITSEKPLSPRFEPYRIKVKASEMHHVMSFAKLYMGDSQTMAAESGVLGIPFIRFNDFVGRIGYLNELENDYKLGYGISPDNPEQVIETINEILNNPNCEYEFQMRRRKMLSEKIDLNQFLIWFINTFPTSKEVMRVNPEIQKQFISAPQTILEVSKEAKHKVLVQHG